MSNQSTMHQETEYSKEVVMTGKTAERLSGLALHRQDLEYCQNILYRYKHKLNNSQNDLCNIIWTALIIKFTLCFSGNQARTKLSVEKVFPQENGVRAIYKEIDDIRDKYIAHDVNSMRDSKITIRFDSNGLLHEQRFYILGVNGMRSDIYDKIVFLVGIALVYVASEITRCTEKLHSEIAAMTPEQRKALQPWSYSAQNGMFELGKARTL